MKKRVGVEVSKTKAEMSDEDISRYIDWCREFGVEEGQRMNRQALKNKKAYMRKKELK